MKSIFGTKLGMIQLFDVNGNVCPATVIFCEPNCILQCQQKKLKIGFGSIKQEKLNKPQLGFFKKINSQKFYRFIKEIENTESNLKVGEEIKVNQFQPGEFVDVQGTTKGRGFTGAIKRWNFKIGPLGHGAGYPHRFQGSIAMGRGGSQAQRVAKGQKMAGHYGNELQTIQNLEILQIDLKNNTMVVKGAIPGHNGNVVFIKQSRKNKTATTPVKLMTITNNDNIKLVQQQQQTPIAKGNNNE